MSAVAAASSGWQRLAFGQLLSLLQASTGVINALLQEKRGVNAPVLQAALTYTLLAAICCFNWRNLKTESRRSQPTPPTATAALVGAAVFDVLGSWMIVAAFAGLHLSQVILLLGLSTPASLAISHCWNPQQRRLTWTQMAGIGVALSCIVLYCGSSGVTTVLTASRWHLLLGVGAALCYASSNNCQECACAHVSSHQFLLWLGSIGAALSWPCLLSLSLSLRRDELLSLQRADSLVFVLLAGYVAVLASFYALIPVYLRRYGSAVSFNLSLLTANLIGGVAECLLLRGGRVEWKAMAAIGGLCIGLVIFYANEPDGSVNCNKSDQCDDISRDGDGANTSI